MTATQIESGTWPDTGLAKALFSGRRSSFFSAFVPNTHADATAGHAVSIGMAQCANVSHVVNFRFGPAA